MHGCPRFVAYGDRRGYFFHDYLVLVVSGRLRTTTFAAGTLFISGRAAAWSLSLAPLIPLAVVAFRRGAADENYRYVALIEIIRALGNIGDRAVLPVVQAAMEIHSPRDRLRHPARRALELVR